MEPGSTLGDFRRFLVTSKKRGKHDDSENRETLSVADRMGHLVSSVWWLALHSMWIEGLNNTRATFKLPGDGLHCGECGTDLPRVERTRNGGGLVIRERTCPKCGQINETIERVFTTRDRRQYSRRVDDELR